MLPVVEPFREFFDQNDLSATTTVEGLSRRAPLRDNQVHIRGYWLPWPTTSWLS